MSESMPARNVTAVLGPTNTGKTHLAIERMLGHESGVIGLPLRLLAREVYDKIVARIGPAEVALITGEEKIKPANPRFHVCTVEAMPKTADAQFVAVDEIQLAADSERGHVFTDRLLHARGASETLLLGATTMRDVIRDLLPDANMVSRSRLSNLSYAGQKKVSRLPRRSAIVAFSASEVYEIAELVRRQRGGAAVVMGALSPKTRNAQVELFQSGDVDFIVATDAIGMGLNLDVDHVAFAAVRKFDGVQNRDLTPSEIGQIAGRAGRHMNDGTFGVTANVEPFSSDLVNALESHEFEPVRVLQWRNRALDYSSTDRLIASLQEAPTHARLAKARKVDDVIALETLSRDPDVARIATAPAAIRRLWDVCQIPDYRKISAASHAELLSQIYLHLLGDTGHIDEDWLAQQVALSDRTDGDIDTLANRIAHIRTWTFVSHRSEWLADPDHWCQRTREIEDKLSDALHDRLTQRFVDRRTSTLMKRLRDKDELYAEIGEDGAIEVERHFVGRLLGFRFTPDTATGDIHGKAARHAASRVVVEEVTRRAARLAEASDAAFSLGRAGEIVWEGAAVARLEKGETPLRPDVKLLVDEHLNGPDRERVAGRINDWVRSHIAGHLKPLIDLDDADDITGLARGVAYRLIEQLGVLKREAVAEEIRALDQEARGQLRKYGVRFGAFHIYVPVLLKPAASELALLLWTLHYGRASVNGIPEMPRQGLTSAPVDAEVPAEAYTVAGFHVCGTRVVRIDMLERLADMIRPLVAWRANSGAGDQPSGATGDGGFRVQPDMMSIIGCSGADFAGVLKALGFRCERKPVVEAGSGTSTDTKQQSPETKQRPAAPAEADTAAARHKQQNTAIAGKDQTGTAAAELSAAPEPAFDEVWRPRRKGPRSTHRPRSRQPGDQRGAKAARRASPRKGKRAANSGRPTKPPKDNKKVSRKPDPDSPFAALQDLKRELEDGLKGEA